MSISNNINVLPWYSNLDSQNHRKSYADYGIYPLLTPVSYAPPFQIIVTGLINNSNISDVRIYNVDGTTVPGLTYDLSGDWIGNGLRVINKTSYSIVVNDGLGKITNTPMPEGRYYLTMTISGRMYWSDVFTFSSGADKQLKLEWWDNQDFSLGKYVIDYTPPFKNFIYLQTQLGKPEYVFEEEATKRDGYVFVEKQISEKRYKFEFLAPEYLCDALRIVRMHDNVRITNFNTLINAAVYDADSILITPKWQDTGDIAVVEAEFDCNTVLKKIGKKMDPATTLTDYNIDYNPDYF